MFNIICFFKNCYVFLILYYVYGKYEKVFKEAESIEILTLQRLGGGGGPMEPLLIYLS